VMPRMHVQISPRAGLILGLALQGLKPTRRPD